MNINQAYAAVMQHKPRSLVCRHHMLAAKCGYYATAKYLKRRDYTLEQALAILGFKLRMPLPGGIYN